MERSNPFLKDPSEVLDWTESDVPLARRGVSVDWLVGFVNAVQDYFSLRLPQQAIPPYELGMADLTYLPMLMNVHAFVEHVVKPITAALKAPLYAFVPDEEIGPPDVFLTPGPG